MSRHGTADWPNRPLTNWRDAGDLTTAEGRAHAAEDAAALVAQHPNALVRDQYLVSIADRCRLDVEQLRQRSLNRKATSAKRPRERSENDGDPLRTPERLTPETQALRLLAHRPGEIAGHLSEILFADPTSLSAYRALSAQGEARAAVSALNADSDGEAAAALLARLVVEDSGDDQPVGVLSRLLSLAAERLAVELEAVARRDDDLATYQPSISYLRTQVIQLREPGFDVADLEPLLRWLIDYWEGRSDA